MRFTSQQVARGYKLSQVTGSKARRLFESGEVTYPVSLCTCLPFTEFFSCEDNKSGASNSFSVAVSGRAALKVSKSVWLEIGEC